MTFAIRNAATDLVLGVASRTGDVEADVYRTFVVSLLGVTPTMNRAPQQKTYNAKSISTVGRIVH